MTTDVLDAPVTGGHDAHDETARGSVAPWWLVACFAASGALLSIAEYSAVSTSGTFHFLIFWAAYALVLAPVAWLVVRKATSSALLAPLVVGLAVWGDLPKLVRTGSRILYADEFAHFRMLQDLVRTGHLVSSDSLLQIGASFPGLELVTSALAHVSGLGLVPAALGVAAAAHVALLVGVFVLVRDLSHSPRAGAIAAVLYSLNPSWLFFDAQFSYETLALPLAVWGLVFAMRAITAPRTDRRGMLVNGAYAVALAVAIVITHHVTSAVYAAVLVGLAIVVSIRAGAKSPSEATESVGVAWALAVIAAVVTLWRFLVVGHALWVYIGPSGNRVSNAWHQLLSLLGLHGSLPGRTAFGGNNLPFYEVLCGYLMVPVLLVAFVWAVWGLLRALRSAGSLLVVFMVVGVVYFASLALVTTAQFSESVHRSWAYSFVGLAAVVGVAVARHLDGTLELSMRARRLWPPPASAGTWVRVAAAIGLAVVAIGGVATGASASLRFGGAIEAGTDALSIGTQTQMVATWFSDNAAPGAVVFADRYVARPIAIAAPVELVDPSTLWALTFAHHVGLPVLDELAGEHVAYVVVDRRMGAIVPPQGYWYATEEPRANTHTKVPAQNITRFGCFTWLNATFATTDYEVFTVDTAALDTAIAQGSAGIAVSCAAEGIS